MSIWSCLFCLSILVTLGHCYAARNTVITSWQDTVTTKIDLVDVNVIKESRSKIFSNFNTAETVLLSKEFCILEELEWKKIGRKKMHFTSLEIQNHDGQSPLHSL